jgi:mono/diheme cytochrome c family protein
MSRIERVAFRACISVAVGLLLGTVGPATAQTLFTAAQDPAEGEKLFTAKGCVRCHAVRGAGGKVGPDLGRTARPRTFFDLAAALWNHAPKMSERMRTSGMARPRLDTRETGDLVAYLFTLSYFDPKGDPAAGKRVFTAKQCITCHSVGGQGGTIGPDLGSLKPFASPIALASALWNHAPRMTEVMRQRNVPRPTFEGSELVDLIAYLDAAAPRRRDVDLYVLPGRAVEGRRLFTDKRCVVCHPIVARGGEEGPDLVEKQAQRSLVGFAAAMWNKAPRMLQALEGRQIPPPRLAPDEMADIVAYLYSVRYFRQAGDPRNGAILATNKGCLDCHALYGERGKPASDLTTAPGLDTPAGVLAGLWRHAVIDDPRPPRDRRPWPLFRGEEMADLMAFLRTLKRTP